MAAPLSTETSSGEGRLFVVPTAEDLARAAAGRLWGIVRERAAVLVRAGKGPCAIHVALSGGKTPRRAYEVLSAEPYRGKFPWESVQFYQVDERWVLPGDPLSNRRMLEEAIFSRAPVPAANVHAVDTSLPGPAEGARRYEAVLRAAFPVPPGGYPRFDAVILGIGRDGHTASLFPGAYETAPGDAWVMPATGGDPPVPRVTLTLPVLSAAAHVIFLACGKEKAAALRGVLAGDPLLPASRVAPSRGKVTYLADAPAASRAAGRDAGGRR